MVMKRKSWNLFANKLFWIIKPINEYLILLKKIQKKDKNLSWLNINDNEEQICISLSSLNWYSKCSYTNSVCSQFNKTCFELEGYLFPTVEDSSNALTSYPKNIICQ